MKDFLWSLCCVCSIHEDYRLYKTDKCRVWGRTSESSPTHSPNLNFFSLCKHNENNKNLLVSLYCWDWHQHCMKHSNSAKSSRRKEVQRCEMAKIWPIKMIEAQISGHLICSVNTLCVQFFSTPSLKWRMKWSCTIIETSCCLCIRESCLLCSVFLFPPGEPPFLSVFLFLTKK